MSDVEITPRFVQLATLAITLTATSVGLLASPQRDVTDTSVESTGIPRLGHESNFDHGTGAEPDRRTRLSASDGDGW